MPARKKSANSKITINGILKYDRPDVRTIIECLDLSDRRGVLKHLMVIAVDDEGELHPLGDVSRSTQLLLLEMMRERIAAGDLSEADVNDPDADDLLRQYWLVQQQRCENCELLDDDQDEAEA